MADGGMIHAHNCGGRREDDELAVTEQEILEEQQEILEEVKEIKKEVKGSGVMGKLFLGSLAGAVVGITWAQRRRLPGLGKKALTRG